MTRSRDARDDTVMLAVTNGFSKKGIQVLSITEIAPHLLVEEGCLTAQAAETLSVARHPIWLVHRPRYGRAGYWAEYYGERSVGARRGSDRGTDALIPRTGKLCPRGGFTLIKVAKPQQDMRFDVPTIGLNTIQGVVRAGGKAISIEAGRTIFVDREAAIAYADKHGIAIVGAILLSIASHDSMRRGRDARKSSGRTSCKRASRLVPQRSSIFG